MVSPMFALLAIAPVLGVGAQELYECLDGGVGPCLNGACQDATLQCINTTAGEICCLRTQVVLVTTTAATATTPSTNTSCVDLVNPRTGTSDCPYRTHLCGNALYADVMRVQCPRTCGFCTDSGSTAAPPVGPTVCQDLVNISTGKSDCGNRYSLCRNPIYKALMAQQCPRTCGYC